VPANGFKRRKPDGFGFARLQDGKIRRGDVNRIRQVIQAHLPFRQHDVKVDNDRHRKFL
jgi:hypothetical protein